MEKIKKFKMNLDKVFKLTNIFIFYFNKLLKTKYVGEDIAIIQKRPPYYHIVINNL